MTEVTDVTRAKLPLATGGAIPVVGLGVWQASSGASTKNAVLAALKNGYRHIDTASIYGNEVDVGAAVRESGLPRGEVFVTTKLWNDAHGFDSTLSACEASLQRLGLDYVDLYLVHWPVETKRKDTWRAMERLRAEGRAKAVGVSNYLVPHLRELEGYAAELPSVNQIEIHPFLQHRETRAWCKQKGIVVEAYSPLTSGDRLHDAGVTRVAQSAARSNAQVLLRWGVQHGLVVLPKSVHEARIVENAQLFDFALDAAQMAALDALEDGTATGWDPRTQK